MKFGVLFVIKSKKELIRMALEGHFLIRWRFLNIWTAYFQVDARRLIAERLCKI